MPTSTNRHRVLVVDDDPGVRGFVKLVLSEAGHIVETANDGEEALARLERENYSVVVSDLEMPRIKGLEVLRELRARGRAMPLLLMSGSLTDEVIAECKRYDAVGWIPKPFTPADLTEAFDKVAPRSLSPRADSASPGAGSP